MGTDCAGNDNNKLVGQYDEDNEVDRLCIAMKNMKIIMEDI